VHHFRSKKLQESDFRLHNCPTNPRRFGYKKADLAHAILSELSGHRIAVGARLQL